jgi:hypothetical protein
MSDSVKLNIGQGGVDPHPPQVFHDLGYCAHCAGGSGLRKLIVKSTYGANGLKNEVICPVCNRAAGPDHPRQKQLDEAAKAKKEVPPPAVFTPPASTVHAATSIAVAKHVWDAMQQRLTGMEKRIGELAQENTALKKEIAYLKRRK